MPTKQQKAAREIAEIMYASLQQFPEEEQQKLMAGAAGVNPIFHLGTA